MIILTDCDGVLADFIGGLCRKLSVRCVTRTPDDIRHWDLHLSLSPQEIRVAHDIMSAPGFCRDLEWYEGAQAFARELSAEGEVHAVTAPFRNGSTWMHERLSWLSAEMPSDRVHFVAGRYKHLMRGDVLIEDHPQTAHDWLDANERGMAILIDRPWNRPGAHEWHMHRRMYRATSYNQAIQMLRDCA